MPETTNQPLCCWCVCVCVSYTDSLDRLSSESGYSLSKWSAADNVDLSSIFQEFESFYEMKYGRAPRLVRPTTGEEGEEMEKNQAKARRKSDQNDTRRERKQASYTNVARCSSIVALP